MTSDDLNRLLAKPGYAVVAESKPTAKPAFSAALGAITPAPASNAASGQGKRLRQKIGPQMNKLESEFFVYLKAERPGAQVLAQSVTLKLGNGVRFTPDFFVMADATNEHERPVTELVAYETKGEFMRDDAAVKLKVAAAIYPQIRFHLVTKRKKKLGGGWAIEEVLP